MQAHNEIVLSGALLCSSQRIVKIRIRLTVATRRPQAHQFCKGMATGLAFLRKNISSDGAGGSGSGSEVSSIVVAMSANRDNCSPTTTITTTRTITTTKTTLN